MWDLRIIQRLKITWQERLGKVSNPFCLFFWAPQGSTVTHSLFYLQCNIFSFKPAKAYSKYRKAARENSILTVSSFVTLSEWFLRITQALSSLVLQALAVWVLHRSLDAWTSLCFAVNSVFNPISPSVRKGEGLETNPQPCRALELLPNIPELQCSPVELPSLLFGQQVQDFLHWLRNWPSWGTGIPPSRGQHFFQLCSAFAA